MSNQPYLRQNCRDIPGFWDWTWIGCRNICMVRANLHYCMKMHTIREKIVCRISTVCSEIATHFKSVMTRLTASSPAEPFAFKVCDIRAPWRQERIGKQSGYIIPGCRWLGCARRHDSEKAAPQRRERPLICFSRFRALFFPCFLARVWLPSIA